jgi:hypothetical protein
MAAKSNGALIHRQVNICLVLILLCAPSSLPAQTNQAAPAQPVKIPAPPLFPKHRRGVYKNSHNVEVIDATPQSPPLETDDPSVPDRGEYEINLLASADLTSAEHRVNLFQADVNYGLLPRVLQHELPMQVKVEAPLAARSESGQPFTVGVGAVLVGLKINFFNNERTGVRVSVYPQFEVAPSTSVSKSLADPGQTLLVPLLVSKELRYMTLVANAGIEKSFHDHNRDLTGTFGLGFGRAIWRKVAVMGEVRGESTFDFVRDRMLSASAGIMYGQQTTVWYARLGHSLFADDGSHVFFAAGVKLIIKPRQRGPRAG